MVVYCSPLQVGNKQVFEVKCANCGEIIGECTGEEVLALTTGEYGKVLCFSCEDKLCPQCQLVETGGEVCTLCWLERNGVMAKDRLGI